MYMRWRMNKKRDRAWERKKVVGFLLSENKHRDLKLWRTMAGVHELAFFWLCMKVISHFVVVWNQTEKLFRLKHMNLWNLREKPKNKPSFVWFQQKKAKTVLQSPRIFNIFFLQVFEYEFLHSQSACSSEYFFSDFFRLPCMFSHSDFPPISFSFTCYGWMQASNLRGLTGICSFGNKIPVGLVVNDSIKCNVSISFQNQIIRS